MTAFMRNSDAFTWAMETDPRLRSTVVTVIMLERVPDWAAVRNRFDRISRMLPMFRQRVAQSPPPAPPRWESAPDFDLDFHLRRVTAPAPGTLQTVLEMARLAQMADFDRARPLWEATLIDGLEDGAAALLCRFHHALTDGVGGVQIGMILFDLEEGPSTVEPLPAEPQAQAASWFTGYGDTIRYNAGLAGAAVSAVVKSAPGWLFGGIRRPQQTLSSAAATAASIYRTVRPVNSTGSPLMTRRSLVRHLAVHDVPLHRLREAAHRCDGALNDAFVAAVAGGLRRYHDKHGVGIGDLHLTMPINLRATTDAMGGNHITLMRFDIPAGVADPSDRISEIRRRTDNVRHERSLPYTQTIAGALNLMPRWYIGSILRHVDFVASDVPGIPVPVYLGGARVGAQYAFGPTIGAAVNVTLLTYAGTCHFGINVDTGAIPDYDLFHDCLVEGFQEVLALAES
ncbi:wax ester/triacylglycerol synthase domain-containing protein [Mycobacterium sp. 852014-52144_SCH5372336]|uniref:wax ester/triacylglycerol synthase domain-containing protein n=1 Tax=Mycobacterium sp. 852014-52144_SCH5372336 TaxID=1834115 RepID=UPI0008023DDC|nr:wax ester/triacylglycerol synthase domain-containing protein [Mycobacterium sp. 852014-52144_SCH5372336]OBB76786.1 diacylglycerol O-acyltransferase [Mycobacterium sp. 852014-52144_SCH5372336]